LVGNHLREQSDMDVLVAGFDLAREVAASPPLAEVNLGALKPTDDILTRADKEAWIRHHVELLYHPTCTARMGPEGEAVVDPELRVHGVEGLRVADASVMPVVTRGNTNAPTIMIGERASDFILGSR
jgi:choline dehydrogenase